MVIGILNSTLRNDKKKKWSSEPTIKNETEPKSLTSRKNNLILKIMKKTFLKTGLFLVVALLAISCSKDGETGPAGPAGANGTNGNANVIGTNTITTTSSYWTSYEGGIMWYTSLQAQGITQSIVDKGIVSVFRSNTAGWDAMPSTFGFQSWTYSFGVGFVNIYTTYTNLITFPNPDIQTFRVVIISPSNRLSHPNTDWNDYNQVKEALHLRD